MISSYSEMRLSEMNTTRIEIKSAFEKVKILFQNQINLLCIEDNEHVRFLLFDEFFQSPIFHKKPAATVKDAQKVLSSKIPYHCWILDLTLEKHNDGLELLKSRSHPPYCIVISGAQSMTDASYAMKDGAYSCWDKNEILLKNPHDFIKDTCALSALSFALKTRRSVKFSTFILLLKDFIQTHEAWAKKSCINENTHYDYIKDETGMTPLQFLYLFHSLYAVSFSDCLVQSHAGYHEAFNEIQKSLVFYEHCSEYVAAHFDKVYRPLFEI